MQTEDNGAVSGVGVVEIRLPKPWVLDREHQLYRHPCGAVMTVKAVKFALETNNVSTDLPWLITYELGRLVHPRFTEHARYRKWGIEKSSMIAARLDQMRRARYERCKGWSS